MKKIFLGILALAVIVCACFALAACGDPATNETLSEEGSALEYEQVADGYSVVGLAEGCTDTTLVIPSGHNGKPVTEIGESAFKLNETITKVVFPNTIKRIDTWAFGGCAALESVLLPDGLEKLGDAAFNKCEALRTVNIPASIKEIGQSVFGYNSALETVTADEGLNCFGAYMFVQCTSLKSVEFPKGLETIGYMAFGYCSSLTKVDFPDTLIDIGGYAFYGAPIEHIVIPGNVRYIGGDAFTNTATKKLTLNEGLRGIGQFAFAHTAIEELVIPNTVTDLGMQAFLDCKKLKTVKIGTYCNYVQYGTFAVCTAIETVIVPKQLYVVDSAFAGCQNIKSVYYKGEELSPNYKVGEESNENEKNAYGNKYYCEADFYLYSEEPNADGGHWHYDEDGQPEVWTE